MARLVQCMLTRDLLIAACTQVCCTKNWARAARMRARGRRGAGQQCTGRQKCAQARMHVCTGNAALPRWAEEAAVGCSHVGGPRTHVQSCIATHLWCLHSRAQPGVGGAGHVSHCVVRLGAQWTARSGPTAFFGVPKPAHHDGRCAPQHAQQRVRHNACVPGALCWQHRDCRDGVPRGGLPFCAGGAREHICLGKLASNRGSRSAAI